MRQSLEVSFLDTAHIVFTTLSSAGVAALDASSRYDVLVVDEAAQAVELSTIIPMKYVLALLLAGRVRVTLVLALLTRCFEPFPGLGAASVCSLAIPSSCLRPCSRARAASHYTSGVSLSELRRAATQSTCCARSIEATR